MDSIRTVGSGLPLACWRTAKEVLSDDYQTSGYQFKVRFGSSIFLIDFLDSKHVVDVVDVFGSIFSEAKQKTSWQGSVVTTAVDLVPGSKDG